LTSLVSNQASYSGMYKTINWLKTWTF